MRAIACQVLVAHIVGAGFVGCGEVKPKAKSDGGGNNGDCDAAMPDSPPDAPAEVCAASSFSCGTADGSPHSARVAA